MTASPKRKLAVTPSIRRCEHQGEALGLFWVLMLLVELVPELLNWAQISGHWEGKLWIPWALTATGKLRSSAAVRRRAKEQCIRLKKLVPHIISSKAHLKELEEHFKKEVRNSACRCMFHNFNCCNGKC